MTNAEKIKNVQARVGNDKLATDDLIAIYLDDATDAILKQRYPFGVPSSFRYSVNCNNGSLNCPPTHSIESPASKQGTTVPSEPIA